MTEKTATCPVVVEVLAYAPSEFYHCTHCELVWQQAGIGPVVHREQRESGLPPDLLEEYGAISTWAHGLYERFGDAVVIKLVDPASLEGFFKSLRHWVHRYPGYMVNGKALPGGSLLDDVSLKVGELLKARNVT